MRRISICQSSHLFVLIDLNFIVDCDHFVCIAVCLWLTHYQPVPIFSSSVIYYKSIHLLIIILNFVVIIMYTYTLTYMIKCARYFIYIGLNFVMPYCPNMFKVMFVKLLRKATCYYGIKSIISPMRSKHFAICFQHIRNIYKLVPC